MRTALHGWSLLLALLLATAVALPFATTVDSRRDFYFFTVELTSDQAGQTQVFFDMGAGYNEPESSRQPLHREDRPVVYRYMLPTGQIRALRLDPIDRTGRMTLANARIVDHRGRLIHAFDPADFRPAQQIATLTDQGGRLALQTEVPAGDPIIELHLERPVPLPCGPRQVVQALLPLWLATFGLSIALVAAAGATRARLVRLYAGVCRRPVLALMGASALAVVIQCHPVIFFGQSFASPDNGGLLLYDRFPTLPGYETADLEEARNADVGAFLYQHLYYPQLQANALLNHGEWPLWNRYALCGVPLLGQGQSMFGEVLNFLPLFTGSAAWAWDLKFVVARWLYGFGLGLVVWRLTRHLGASLLTAFVGIFVGFFTYRLSHPAIFSVCFSPWILVAWLVLRDAAKPRQWLGAVGLLMFANWEVFTSGTVKEAYMNLACMNLAGVLVVLGADEMWRLRLRRFAAAAVGGVLFLLLAAPWWLTFLDALRASRTSYDFPAAMQLAPWQLIGFFEDLFYRQLIPNENHGYPNANFLILAGLAWLLASAGLRRGFDRGITAIAVAALLPLGMVFKLIPEALIVKLPFIANIHHVSNTFSCALLVLATPLAGCGWHRCWQAAAGRRWGWELVAATAVIGLLAGAYFLNVNQVSWSPFFIGYGTSLGLGLLVLLLATWVWHRGQIFPVTAVALLGSMVLFTWRHGQYVSTPFDTYVFNPKVRADLHAASPVVARVNALLDSPSRPAGLGYNLFSGYNQLLLWEGIYGVDALRNGYYDEFAIAGGAKKIRWWDSFTWSEDDISGIQAIQDLFNVRYYLASHSDAPRDIPGLRRLGQYDLDLYESATVWPRAFFTNQFTTYNALEGLLRRVRGTDRRPFAAVAEADVAAANLPVTASRNLLGRIVTPAQAYRLTANTTRFTVDASGPGLVVLTEGYYPRDFRVTVDGVPTGYFRVNHAFKGIPIARSGRHEIVVEYRPHRFNLALALCGLGLIATAGTSWWVLRWRTAPGGSD